MDFLRKKEKGDCREASQGGSKIDFRQYACVKKITTPDTILLMKRLTNCTLQNHIGFSKNMIKRRTRIFLTEEVYVIDDGYESRRYPYLSNQKLKEDSDDEDRVTFNACAV